MSVWEDITDVFHEEGFKKVKTGQIFIFDYEGSPIHLKIMRKTKDKIWAERNYEIQYEDFEKLYESRNPKNHS